MHSIRDCNLAVAQCLHAGDQRPDVRRIPARAFSTRSSAAGIILTYMATPFKAADTALTLGQRDLQLRSLCPLVGTGGAGLPPSVKVDHPRAPR
jgi:hypothetical protein